MGGSDFYGGWITSNIKGRMKGGECLMGVAMVSILILTRCRYLGMVMA
jgi:hypothetical protein